MACQLETGLVPPKVRIHCLEGRIKLNMKLWGDMPSLKVENQCNCCCTKRGLAEVDSNPAPVLPLVEDPSRVLQSIVKNINWTAKGHPSHWVGHDLGAGEDFTWRLLEIGGWCFIVAVAACDCCIGPKDGRNGFLPTMLCMNQLSPSKFLKLSDPSLGNPRLKVCIHSRVRIGLFPFLTSILPWLGGEDAIVGMIVKDLDTIKSTVPFKGCLATEGLLCCLGLLQMHKSIA